MTATGEKHWHASYYFPAFILWTRHDEEGNVTLEILAALGIIPIAVKLNF